MSFLDEIEKNYFPKCTPANVAKPAKVHRQSTPEITNFSNFSNFSVSRPSEVKKTQPQKARGYGCSKCGNNIYSEFHGWKPGTFKSAYQPVDNAWQCDKCGAVYSLIGGTRGPEYLS